MQEISTFALPGIPEVRAGDDVAELIITALADGNISLKTGDILAVTSKIVSKAEGRFFPESEYQSLLEAETHRIVATGGSAEYPTRIVESRLGIVAAAAGIDRSNAPEGQILGLPLDPDASAANIRNAVENALGVEIGVIITDTAGRAWRLGQTDIVIGSSGVKLLVDLAGEADANGRELIVTAPAVGDEIAAMTDLVKAKSGNTPVAVVRGLRELLDKNAGGAQTLIRSRKQDMFSAGVKEAYQAGVLGKSIHPEPFDWTVIVLGRGGGKSRINVQPGLQNALADAFALDTTAAFLASERVGRVALLTTSNELADNAKKLGAEAIIADGGTDMNAQITSALADFAENTPVIVVVGDLPQLTPADILPVVELASFSPKVVLADRNGTGTTLIAAKNAQKLSPFFGVSSFEAHKEAGFIPIEMPVDAPIRDDIDTIDDLKRNRHLLGANSQAVLLPVLLNDFFGEANTA